MPYNPKIDQGSKRGNYVILQTLSYPPVKVETPSDLYRFLLCRPQKREELLALFIRKSYHLRFERVWVYHPALNSPLLLSSHITDDQLSYTLSILLLNEQGLELDVPLYK